MEYFRTFVLLAIFIFLAVVSIINNIRHHGARKEARAQRRAEKRIKRIERRHRRRMRFAGMADFENRDPDPEFESGPEVESEPENEFASDSDGDIGDDDDGR